MAEGRDVAAERPGVGSGSAAMLLCVGDLNADVAITPAGPVVPGSDTPGTVALSAGGSASNVAATAARLGVATRFAGVVGDDALGRLLVDDLVGRGVEVRAVVRPDTSSRSVAVVVGEDGDRSMVSDLSTATVLRGPDVQEAWFDGIAWLHLTAYTWFPAGGARAWGRLVGLATEAGIPWSVDPSSARMLLRERSVGEAVIAFGGASVIFPSHDEAEALTGLDDPAAAAGRLLDVADTAVVTTGEHGVTVARRGRTVFSASAHPSIVVNTIGCGDAFAAGFIAGRIGGSDDRACADSGLAAASQVLAVSTAR